jgi:hypothetical protein
MDLGGLFKSDNEPEEGDFFVEPLPSKFLVETIEKRAANVLSNIANIPPIDIKTLSRETLLAKTKEFVAALRPLSFRERDKITDDALKLEVEHRREDPEANQDFDENEIYFKMQDDFHDVMRNSPFLTHINALIRDVEDLFYQFEDLRPRMGQFGLVGPDISQEDWEIEEKFQAKLIEDLKEINPDGETGLIRRLIAHINWRKKDLPIVGAKVEHGADGTKVTRKGAVWDGDDAAEYRKVADVFIKEINRVFRPGMEA